MFETSNKIINKHNTKKRKTNLVKACLSLKTLFLESDYIYMFRNNDQLKKIEDII